MYMYLAGDGKTCQSPKLPIYLHIENMYMYTYVQTVQSWLFLNTYKSTQNIAT